MQRRDFLHTVGASLVAQCLPSEVMGGSNDFWSRPREVWLERPSTGEFVREVYFANGVIVQDGYQRACRLLRDVRANQAVTISPVLLDILCGVQGWLSAFGLSRPLITHSGYRTAATNAQTEGAARQSKHMEGRAWDGHIAGVSPDSLAQFGRYLSGGGVGFYQDKGFVHLDDGALRYWRG